MPLPREALRAHPTPMTRVYLVAAGDLPMPFDVELVEHYERTLGLPVERLRWPRVMIYEWLTLSGIKAAARRAGAGRPSRRREA